MRSMTLQNVFLAAVLACLAAANVGAATMPFSDVVVNTGSISETAGYLEFQFAPGMGADPAAVAIHILGFDGLLLAPPELNGGASGAFPAIAIDNSTAFNDFFQAVQFGSTLHFYATFSGTSENMFGFALYDSTGENPLLSTDPSGFLFTQSVGPDGALTTYDFSGGTANIVTPEPGTLALAVFGLAVAPVVRRIRSRR